MQSKYSSDEFLDHVEILWQRAIEYADRRENFSADEQHDAQQALVAVIPRLLQDITRYREALERAYQRSSALEQELEMLNEKMTTMGPVDGSPRDPAP